MAKENISYEYRIVERVDRSIVIERREKTTYKAYWLTFLNSTDFMKPYFSQWYSCDRFGIRCPFRDAQIYHNKRSAQRAVSYFKRGPIVIDPCL